MLSERAVPALVLVEEKHGGWPAADYELSARGEVLDGAEGMTGLVQGVASSTPHRAPAAVLLTPQELDKSGRVRPVPGQRRRLGVDDGSDVLCIAEAAAGDDAPNQEAFERFMVRTGRDRH